MGNWELGTNLFGKLTTESKWLEELEFKSLWDMEIYFYFTPGSWNKNNNEPNLAQLNQNSNLFKEDNPYSFPVQDTFYSTTLS